MVSPSSVDLDKFNYRIVEARNKMGKVFLISGNDDHALKDKARAIVEQLCGENFDDNPSLEIISGDGDNERRPHLVVGDCISSLLTPPFLSSDKTVWLRNLSFEVLSKSSGTEKGDLLEQELEKLKEIIEAGIAKEVNLVVSGAGMDRRSSLYKFLQKHAEVHFFAKADINAKDFGEAVRGIVYDYCAGNEMKISRDAIEYLSMATGADSGRIKSELDKLLAFISPRKDIRIEDCVQICSRTPEAATWAYSNAVSDKNLHSALSALELTLDTTKNAEMGILYSLISTFNSMVAIKNAATILGLGSRCSYDDFAATLKNPPPAAKAELEGSSLLKMHPYRAYMVLKSSEKFSDSKLVGIISDLMKTNRAMVSGSVIPERMLLEQLTMKICSP